VTDKLEKKVRELYDTVCRLEEEKYDWEFKLRKMDFEVRNAELDVGRVHPRLDWVVLGRVGSDRAFENWGGLGC